MTQTPQRPADHRVPRARALRRDPTEAEKKLWQHLRQPPFKEHHFRRQATIGAYFADFARHQAKLVIELDGGQHSDSASDEVRTRYLEANGYRVLRFWNNDVLANVAGVLATIDAAVNADRPPTPDPSPPQAGGGAPASAATSSQKAPLMPDLLLELFSEEIPARMQAKAADDLRRMVTDKLVAEGLVYEGAKAFATPRRLTLTVHGVPARQSDLKEERRGPRVGGPDAAIAGFLKATGLASIDEAKIQRDPKKGDFYIALIEKPGRATLEVLAEMLPVIIRTFPWPKSMRWGERSARPSALQWVRPLHAIVATFGLETEEPDVVKFAVDGIEAGQTTYGHRFMAPAPISVRRFEDYEAKLLDAKVVLDPERRKDTIVTDAKQLAFAQGFELVEDQGLLDEVAGLVEWPVALMGSFDQDFLSIPGEVVRATIRNNQKCFVVSDPKTKKLTNKFILTANIEASDGGKQIVAGNERVIRARLSDAKFFYETDLKTKLEDRLPKFDCIVFHEKLGTQGERIKRIERLAAEIAPLVGADLEKAKRAAHLAKADLLTEVVGEFPELQGLMGKYYALAQGEDRLRRRGERGALQAAGTDRSRADRSGECRGGAGRQDRYAGRFLGDR